MSHDPILEQKILVTGASGLLGAYLIQHLLHKGYRDIRAIRRADSRLELLEGLTDRLEWVHADILDVADMDEAMRGVDLVFHCAALVSFDPRQKKKLMQVNVEGTANVVNCALSAGVKKFIHVSSIAALGNGKPGEVLDESSVWEKGKSDPGYGLSKYLSEREVWRGMAEGMQVAIVNPSVILGSGRWEEGPGLFFSMIHGGFSFYPTGGTGFVDVRDVAAFMVKLGEKDAAFGKKYILNSENLRYRAFFLAIAEEFGKKPPGIKINTFLRFLAGLVMLPVGLFSKREVMVTPRTLKQAARFSRYNNERSRAMSDFEYIPVRATIAAVCQHFLNTGEVGKLLPPVE